MSPMDQHARRPVYAPFTDEDVPPGYDDPSHVGTLGARSVARRVIRPLLRTWLRLRVEGATHVPTDGPVLIASTHASHADSMALGAAAPRPVFFLGDRRLLAWPVLGRLLPKLGMVALRRGTGDTAAMGVLADLLGAGHAVVVYPEGSRTRDGRVYRPRSGVVPPGRGDRRARRARGRGRDLRRSGPPGSARACGAAASPIRFGPAIAPPSADTPAARRRVQPAAARHARRPVRRRACRHLRAGAEGGEPT